MLAVTSELSFARGEGVNEAESYGTNIASKGAHAERFRSMRQNCLLRDLYVQSQFLEPKWRRHFVCEIVLQGHWALLWVLGFGLMFSDQGSDGKGLAPQADVQRRGATCSENME